MKVSRATVSIMFDNYVYGSVFSNLMCCHLYVFFIKSPMSGNARQRNDISYKNKMENTLENRNVIVANEQRIVKFPPLIYLCRVLTFLKFIMLTNTILTRIQRIDYFHRAL